VSARRPSRSQGLRSALTMWRWWATMLLPAVAMSGVVLLAGAGPAVAVGWRATSVPVPAGTSSASLNAVSCARRSLCWAVGTASTLHHGKRAFIERWNGRAWRLEPVPLPVRLGQTGLFGISCSGPLACMAVGSTSADDGGTFSERWREGSWHYVATPSPSDTALGAVSCSSASNCLAVGSTDTFKDGIFNYSLNLVWNGAVWTRQPYRETGSMDAVSCASATFCAGVGVISDSAGNNTAAEQWNGTEIADVPSGDGNAGALQGVSCASATFCMAVGSEFGRIASLWNGKRWRPIGSPGRLDAVSCTGSRLCVAVGGRIANWNGASWALAPTRLTAASSLNSVTCSRSSTCLAVGSSGSKPVALRYG
jgi:hypothetical protein